MKITQLFSFFLIGCLFSCKNNVANKEVSTTKTDVVAAMDITPTLNLIGSFVGPFGDNKITFLISKIAGDTIEGRSVVGGNDRPFKGTVKMSEGKYIIKASEPGDDKHDGNFEATLDTKTPDKITGTWVPYKQNASITAKNFVLDRKAFTYLKDVGIYPQASNKLLRDEDVENLLKGELEIMRNEIFARHGYCFKKKDLRNQFEDKDWYVPASTDVTASLTDIEKKNITLIKKYEKYASEYGDDFGR